jgi:NitT/TauT family transport system permease protein
MSGAPTYAAARHSRIASAYETAKNVLYPTMAIAVLMIAWFIGVWLFRPPLYVLPPPTRVWEKTVDQWPSLYEGIVATTQVALAGLMVAVVVGVVLGMSIGWWTAVRKLLLPPIIITQSIPKIAIAPLLIVWFGYGAFPKLIIVVLVTFFPILEACAVGIRSLPRSTFILSQSMGLRSTALFFKILLPASLPYLMGAFQVSASLALIGALTAEFVGAEVGIGVVLRTAVGNQDTALAFASILLCAVAGTLIYALSMGITRLIAASVSPAYVRRAA